MRPSVALIVIGTLLFALKTGKAQSVFRALTT